MSQQQPQQQQQSKICRQTLSEKIIYFQTHQSISFTMHFDVSTSYSGGYNLSMSKTGLHSSWIMPGTMQVYCCVPEMILCYVTNNRMSVANFSQ